MLISTQADLEAALLAGGDIACDPTVVIDLTDTMVVGLPTRLLGGTFTISSGTAFRVTSSDVEIAALSITGPGGTTLDTSQRLISAVGTEAAPLTGIDVHDCQLSGSMSDSVWLEWCVDSSVRGCAVSDFLDSGIMVISGNRVAVANNAVFDGHLATGAVEVYGIAITDLLNTATARSRHCTVTGNRVHEIDWEGIDTHGGDGIVVTGNTVTACRRGIALVTGNATRIAVPMSCVASGNLVDGTGARVTPDIGVFLAGSGTSLASATITGNTIAGYDSAQPISTINWNRADTTVANNSRPHVNWSNVTLATGWTANATFPPQYMVDGNTVSFRGGVIPPTGGVSAHPVIGSLAAIAAWPAERVFYATTHGSSGTAGIGVLNVDTNGAFRIDYGTTSDSFTYWLTGGYTAA
ncbi:MAG TPA: right-handed parallel beta-helix repeat-containing protein [Pseudonocardiaceae bacterium]|jgi:parallel beta-helix repeat protein|nr:right-handed parallel beta-helix repeat-containing protein [Pseudonocardiaceae bacterium]